MAALYTSPEFMHEEQCPPVRSTFVMEVERVGNKYVVTQVDIEDGMRWNATPVFERDTLQECIDQIALDTRDGLQAVLTPVEKEDGTLTYL